MGKLKTLWTEKKAIIITAGIVITGVVGYVVFKKYLNTDVTLPMQDYLIESTETVLNVTGNITETASNL